MCRHGCRSAGKEALPGVEEMNEGSKSFAAVLNCTRAWSRSSCELTRTRGFRRLIRPLAARSRPAVRDLRKAEDVSNLSRGARRRTRGARGQRLSLSRVFQRTLDPRRLRIRFAQNALPQRKDRLERFHGLAEIAERGGVLLGERQRVNPPHYERDSILFPKNASRHGHRSAQQGLGFCVAL